MTTYILTGGHIYASPDKGKAFCNEIIARVDHRPIRILDCLFARDPDIWKQRFSEDRAFLRDNIPDAVVELADPAVFIEQVKNADVVFFQGGVPKRLLTLLDQCGDWKTAIASKVVAASSGGADILCTYYGVGRTMNIGEGVGILPIKFIPHWNAGPEYTDEVIAWDDLLKKLQEHKENLETYPVSEGDYIVFTK